MAAQRSGTGYFDTAQRVQPCIVDHLTYRSEASLANASSNASLIFAANGCNQSDKEPALPTALAGWLAG